jgi:MFS family permease
MGTNGVAGLVGIFALAPVLDRHDRRRFLRAGLVLMAVASLAYRWIEDIGPALYLLRVVQGVAFAAGFNAASTLAAEIAPVSRRAAALGLFGVSTLGTHALAPVLGEQMIQRGGFPLLFDVAAGYSIVGLLLTIGLPGSHVHRTADRGAFRMSDHLRAVIAVVALAGVSFGTVITFAPTFVHDAHLGSVSTFFLSYTMAALGTRFGAAGLGDRIGHRRVIGPALAALGVAIASLAAVHTPLALAIVGVAFGTAQGIMYPTLNAYALDGIPPGDLGKFQTFFNGAFNLGVTAGSFALGNVADAYDHRVVFLCAAATALLALTVFVASGRLDRTGSPSR